MAHDDLAIRTSDVYGGFKPRALAGPVVQAIIRRECRAANSDRRRRRADPILVPAALPDDAGDCAQAAFDEVVEERVFLWFLLDQLEVLDFPPRVRLHLTPP